MKRKSYTALVLILSLLSIFFASCNVSRDEPHTRAYLTQDSLIASVNGRDITALTTLQANTPETRAIIHVKLDGGEFQSLVNDTDVTNQWIYPLENRELGLSFTTKNVTKNSVDLYVTGTTVLSGIERFENDLKIVIPAQYIYGRYSAVTVEGDKKAKIKIYGATDRVAFLASELSYSTAQTGILGPYGPTIRLINTTLRWNNDSDLNTWFNDIPFEVYDNQSLTTGSTEFTLGARARSASVTEAVTPTNGPVVVNATIPAAWLEDGDENGDLECVSYGTYEVTSDTYAYIVNPVSIAGITTLSEVDTLEEKDVVVGLSMGTFNNQTSADVSSWFYNAPQGLVFTLQNYDSLTGQRQAVVRVSGSPRSPSTEPVKIQLPSASYTSAVSSGNGALWVDSNSSYYNITPGDFYSWSLYDIASFDGKSYDITTRRDSQGSLSAVSLNRHLTKTYSGEDIDFDDLNRLTYGSAKDVSFNAGLSRRGYTLKGFAVQKPVGTRISSLEDEDSYINTEVVYTSNPQNIQFALRDEHKGMPLNIFAVWEVDKSSPYWKPIDTVITVTKAMIDDANPEDEYLNDLTHHDGTELENDYKQEMNFIALLGGQLGGTDDAPEYFKWPVSVSGDVPVSTTQDGVIKSDFAMADIPLTAALWNVVYKWATSDDRGETKYKFDIQQNSKDTAMLSGITRNIAASSYDSRHSAEDPIVRMTWYNAVIFANALTEWYNNVVLGETNQDNWLSVAYTEDGIADGNVLRDATLTATLDKINPEEVFDSYSDDKKGIKHVSDATGFRLPTLTEWQYAASVYPESDWNEVFAKHSYPQVLNYNYASGLNEVLTKADVGYSNDINPNLKDYAVYSELYSADANYGTQAVGKYFKADRIRTRGVKSNYIGLYDMSGNVWEWSEDWTVSANPTNRFYSGGSWNSSAGSIRVGSTTSNTPSYRSYEYGIRFCRTLPPTK